MNKVLSAILGTTCLVVASSAHAQATRTWVSGVGDDANPCSRTAPCKTFAGAISKTATNGEINCLDPAGYGAVSITKSITIDCGYTHGSILASNVNGVIINGANIVVTLRGLSINGAATTVGNGVRILNAAAVNIDDVVIENFGGAAPSNGRGVSIETSAGGVRVTIQNSRIWNVNNIGVHSNPTAGSVNLVIDNTSISRTGTSSAVQLRQLTTGMFNRLSATNNPFGAGVSVELGTANATVSNSLLANNSIGVFAGNGGAATVRLYGTVISGNTVDGLQTFFGAQIISSGNNIIRGNTGNQVPTTTETTQ